MYTVRITHHPAPGKGPELRAALEEHSKAANAAGSPHNVSQLLYADEPTFVNSIRHESLAAIEAYTAKNAGDPTYAARTAKITACLARPQTQVLYENLVTAPRTGDANYALRITYHPASGKAAELRQAVEERAKTPSPGSVGKGVVSQVLGAGAPHLALNILFSSLAGFEEYLKARPANADVQSFAARIATLSTGGHTDLYRILLPFPA